MSYPVEVNFSGCAKSHFAISALEKSGEERIQVFFKMCRVKNCTNKGRFMTPGKEGKQRHFADAFCANGSLKADVTKYGNFYRKNQRKKAPICTLVHMQIGTGLDAAKRF